ncbi:MAG: hypothetical protein M1817_005145 [Caeruleum heppii]|nr:MAG: hypothetical protein M1817_005145 [Caeruleum heppii]
MPKQDLAIEALSAAYRDGLSPVSVIRQVYDDIEAYQARDPAVWIYLIPKDEVYEAAEQLLEQYPDPERRPSLFGVPFSIKDNFDIAGIPTTAGCPPLTRVPKSSAMVFRKLLRQGALFIGKTNMEQLATGLTGCRSPFGTPRSVFNHHFIAGGSSSGSAVSVGAKLVSFSIGTDTAGSIRIPAGFNGLVGFKPSKGTISASGVLPACMSLDCVGVLARNVRDAATIWQICIGFDENDIFAKQPRSHLPDLPTLGPGTFRFGVPPAEVMARCAPVYRAMFDSSIKVLEAIGGTKVQVDWDPFSKAGKLFYEGSFVAERLANLPDGWFESHRDDLHPVTRQVLDMSLRKVTAVDVFRDLQKQARFKREIEKMFSFEASIMDTLVVPTAPTHYTVQEVQSDPIATNSILGTFSHFANPLDLTAIALPAGTCAAVEVNGQSQEGRLPFSITIVAPSLADSTLINLAQRFETAAKT